MKYSIDTQTNRLRITRNDHILSPEGFFRIDADNSLEFWLNGPAAWRAQNDLPEKITFSGTWKLTYQDDLQLSVAKASYLPESLSGISRITINGKIIACENNRLIFEVHSRDSRGLGHIRLLKLSGSWGNDDANRLFFSVTKRAAPDILALSGSWVINNNQNITYTIAKQDLLTKQKMLASFDISGYWRISDAHRLSYLFTKGSLSRFDFRAHLESPNMYPTAGVIKYRLGTGVRQPKQGQPVMVSLLGEWKIGRKTGVSFEMEYEQGQFRSLEFGARVNVSKRDRIEFALIDEKNKEIGITLTYTRRFLKSLDAQLFARLKQLSDEKTIEAGITIPF